MSKLNTQAGSKAEVMERLADATDAAEVARLLCDALLMHPELDGVNQSARSAIVTVATDALRRIGV